MKTLVPSALLAAVLLVPALSHAEMEVSAPTLASSLTALKEGSVRVGGGLDVSYGDLDATRLTLTPSIEYFLNDRLSVGGSLAMSAPLGDGMTFWSIGPSATYYFFKQDRFALYFSQSFAFARLTGYGPVGEPGGQKSSLISVSKLGAEYFIVPNVSFGPALQWRHTFGDYLSPQFAVGQNVYSLVGQFSIYF